jgi:hypothetical protein
MVPKINCLHLPEACPAIVISSHQVILHKVYERTYRIQDKSKYLDGIVQTRQTVKRGYRT